MPTLRQLNALSLIAQTRSFTKAAERLFITQSAVSALIKELEEEIGVELVRRGRTISLTDAGDHLYRAGTRAAFEIDRAVKNVRQDRRSPQTVLRVAAGALSAATLLPEALSALAKSAPELKVILFDRPVGMLGDMLLSGEADVAVGSVDSPSGLSGELRSIQLLDDHLVVVCARRSALMEVAEGNGGVTWRDLMHSDLILVGRAGGQWRLLFQDQLAMHDDLRVGHEVQLFSTALELVRVNMGVALLPKRATRYLQPEDFCVTPLLKTSSRWKTYFVTRKEETDLVRKRAGELLLHALQTVTST